jgi:hypothetical protein
MCTAAICFFRWVNLPVVLLISLFFLGPISAGETGPAGKPPVKSSGNNLVGVWESADTTKGGLGAIYEFREDGGLVAGIGALVNLTYDPQDPNLQQLLPDSKVPGDESQPQKIMDGPAGSAPYVGVWKFRHYTGGIAYQWITDDGRILLRVPFPIPWSSYEVKGNKLLVFQKGCPRQEFLFKVTEKTLELTKPGKKKKETISLIRVTPTWYHALTESEVEEARARLQNEQEKADKAKKEQQFDFKVIQ